MLKPQGVAPEPGGVKDPPGADQAAVLMAQSGTAELGKCNRPWSWAMAPQNLLAVDYSLWADIHRSWLPCSSGRLGQRNSCCYCDAFALCRLMIGLASHP